VALRATPEMLEAGKDAGNSLAEIVRGIVRVEWPGKICGEPDDQPKHLMGLC